MPYSNMPKDPALQAKMEKCVADVVKTGKPKKSAIPICYASLMKEGKDGFCGRCGGDKNSVVNHAIVIY